MSTVCYNEGDNEADGDDGPKLGLCHDACQETCSASRHPPLCRARDTIRRSQEHQLGGSEKVH